MNKKADWRKLMEDYRELVELNYDYEARINCLVLVLDLMGQPSAKQVNAYAYFAVLRDLAELYSLSGSMLLAKEALMKLDRILRARIEADLDPLFFSCSKTLVDRLCRLGAYEEANEVLSFYLERCTDEEIGEVLDKTKIEINEKEERERSLVGELAEVPVHPLVFSPL